MSSTACGKEVLCLVAESSAACSKYGEYMTPEEIERCEDDTNKYKRFRIELANRADAADS